MADRFADVCHPVQLAAVLLIVAGAACGDGGSIEGLACDPMVYQLDNQVWVLGEERPTRLTDDPVAANPALSPQGDRIAFTAGPEDDLDLYVMNVDGTGRRLVWAGGGLQSAAAWSPDGRALVFDQTDPAGVLQVYTIPVAGGEPRQLTTGAPNGKPKWHGDTILFLSLRDAEEQEIYSMAPDGSAQTNLTNHPARDVLAETSRDGTRIVFASDRSGNFEIWVMDAGGGAAVQLTDHPERDTNPTWSSDGAHIVFRSDRDPAGLWVMAADGSDATPYVANGWLADCS